MRDDIPILAKSRARAMRQSLTDAERNLWYALRDRRVQSVKFRRQASVGPYITDFLCVQHKLIVEADGSQHGENIRDRARDAWLARNGYKVLRFWNHEILTAQDSVLATQRRSVWPAVVTAQALTPTPLPRAGEGLLAESP